MFKGILGSFKNVVVVPKEDLKRYAEHNYVDSPVYHNANWLVRWLNWKKLDMALGITPPGYTALDFACGNGVLLPSLSKLFCDVKAIDIYSKAAEELMVHQRLFNVQIYKDNGYNLLFMQGTFDVIFALSALEHFKDLEQAISEIYRVLAPGGYLIFLSPSENWFYRLGRWVFGYKKPGDHYYTANEIMEVLKKYFTVEVERGWPVYKICRLRKSNG